MDLDLSTIRYSCLCVAAENTRCIVYCKIRRVRIAVIKGINYLLILSSHEEVEANVTHGGYFHDRSSQLVHEKSDYILGLSPN